MRYFLLVGSVALFIIFGCNAKTVEPCAPDGVVPCGMMTSPPIYEEPEYYDDPELRGTAELRSKDHLDLIRRLRVELMILQLEVKELQIRLHDFRNTVPDAERELELKFGEC